jgi:hypothetical protein
VASHRCPLLGQRVPVQTLELERIAALCGGARRAPS